MFITSRRRCRIFTLTDEQGAFLVRLARHSIEGVLGIADEPSDYHGDPVLVEKCGVFVTLNVHAKGSYGLRGCIGLPYPTSPLVDAVVEAAKSAAFNDPRFPPVQRHEMDGLTMEVSVLTPPMRLELDDRSILSNHVQVGRDGLIIERGWNKGLLLPQVPVEWGWDSKEFLDQCCVKAGIPKRSWMRPDTKVYTFQAILFKEDEPKGSIIRHTLVD